MKDLLTTGDALALAQAISDALMAESELITSLDQQMGDGDLGVTCKLGMGAALEAIVGLQDATLDQILLKAGMAFNSAGASTFGALVATACMRAAKYAKDNGIEAWDLEAIAGAAKAAAEGIEQRGKASQGEKTMLDSLWPGVEALQAAQAEGRSLADGLSDATAAAREGLESTKPLKAKYGRAAWLQDQTVGVQDPGATVTAIVFQALADYLSAQ